MRKTLLSVLLFFSGVASASVSGIQRTIFSADVVASACHIRVDPGEGSDGQLTFDTWRRSTASPVPPREFTLRLYEPGAGVQGCSAFLAGRIATLTFGNPGQLDAGGVVTRGAGDSVRIDVRAIDGQADFRGRLTDTSHIVNYPVAFAAAGQFRFRAQPVIPLTAKPGEYSGALAFVVTYQ